MTARALCANMFGSQSLLASVLSNEPAATEVASRRMAPQLAVVEEAERTNELSHVRRRALRSAELEDKKQRCISTTFTIAYRNEVSRQQIHSFRARTCHARLPHYLLDAARCRFASSFLHFFLIVGSLSDSATEQ